jgi:putative transposase
LRLGIGIERIQPAHPEQNGRHERMHLTLKKEATKPASANFLQQQARFDKFIEVFNNERPHEALDMKCPAEIYQPSTRPYQGLPDIDYPFHDKTIVVTRCGRICLGRKKINFSQVFAGQAVGIKEVQDDIWLVSFMDYDLGYFDLETRVLEPPENPFDSKVLLMKLLHFVNMSPGWTQTGWRRMQSRANSSLLNSLLTGKNTGNFANYNAIFCTACL